MQSKATTVAEYLAELPDDRRKAVAAIRAVIRKNLPKGYAEGMQYGMLGYFVPHSVYPAGYHCDPRQPLPFAGVASQKNHIGIYMFCIYLDETLQKSFVAAWKKTGARLDMGKACVRCKRLEDIPLEVIGDAVRSVPVKKFIETYESCLKPARARTSKAPAAKKVGAAGTSSTTSKAASKATTTAKKPASTTSGTRKTVTKKTAVAKKSVAKKTTTKKSVTKKTAAKKTIRKKR
jgi:hypothetical protein